MVSQYCVYFNTWVIFIARYKKKLRDGVEYVITTTI